MHDGWISPVVQDQQNSSASESITLSLHTLLLGRSGLHAELCNLSFNDTDVGLQWEQQIKRQKFQVWFQCRKHPLDEAARKYTALHLRRICKYYP
jgi:hypothetical protein